MRASRGWVGRLSCRGQMRDKGARRRRGAMLGGLGVPWYGCSYSSRPTSRAWGRGSTPGRGSDFWWDRRRAERYHTRRRRRSAPRGRGPRTSCRTRPSPSRSDPSRRGLHRNPNPPPPALSFRPLLNPPSKTDCPSRQRCGRRGASAPYVGPSAGLRCSQRPPSGHCPVQMSEGPPLQGCSLSAHPAILVFPTALQGLFPPSGPFQLRFGWAPTFNLAFSTRGRGCLNALPRHAGRRHGGARRNRGVEEGCLALGVSRLPDGPS